MHNDSERYDPAPKSEPLVAADELRTRQIQEVDDAVHQHLAQGTKLPVKPPGALSISSRVLVATFLLPYEISIDLESDRAFVRYYGSRLIL